MPVGLHLYAEKTKVESAREKQASEDQRAKLEKALEDRSIEKTEHVGDGVPMYESSSDAGIESGNEVDDSLSEK